LKSISSHPFAPVAKRENHYSSDFITGVPDFSSRNKSLMRLWREQSARSIENSYSTMGLAAQIIIGQEGLVNGTGHLEKPNRDREPACQKLNESVAVFRHDDMLAW